MGGLVKAITAPIAAIGGALTPSTPKPPPLPELPEPATMPDPDDEARQARLKRAVAAKMKASGRASTILSEDTGGKLGG